MSVTVFVNDRSVVHKGSQGTSLAFPDVCLTKEDVPLPFLNLGLSKDAAAGASSVLCDGEPTMIRSSYFARTYGDEPGVNGGVISGCNLGKASFFNYAYDVLIEGEPVPRHMDPMLHNHGSPFNSLSQAIFQIRFNPALVFEDLCNVFCSCNAAGYREECCRQLLATPYWDSVTSPNGERVSRRVWRPAVPGEYVEVPYDRKPPNKVVMCEGCPPVTPIGPAQPGGDVPAIPGTMRPDVVLVKDPLLPPTPDNLAAVYDFKFPGDRWRPGQFQAYSKLVSQGGVTKTPQEISEEKCGCAGRKQLLDPLPERVREVSPEEEYEQDLKDIEADDLEEEALNPPKPMGDGDEYPYGDAPYPNPNPKMPPLYPVPMNPQLPVLPPIELPVFVP